MSKRRKRNTRPANRPMPVVTTDAQPPIGVATTDAFSNQVARLGYGTQNLMEATQYPLTRLTQQYPLLNSLFRSNWIVKNIISTVPNDVTKRWYRLSSSISPEMLKRFKRVERTTKLKAHIVSGMSWGRLYGGAAGIILLAGQENLELPLDLDMIMPDSFRGLYIVDRWSGIYPSIGLVEDLYDPDYGLPEYYEVRDAVGVSRFRIHHSRIIRFLGRELPWQESIAELHWGQSELEGIYEELVKRDNVSSNMASLTFKANLDVMTVKNLDQMFSLTQYEMQKRFWDVMQAQSVVQSNLGVRMIGENDQFNQYQYNFAGLRDVYEAMLLDIAGAAQIPATRLYGRSPAGMNATGESDQQNYNDHLDEIREADFRPVLEKLLPIMAISCWGYIPDDMEIIFDPIKSMSETERADVAKKKTETLTQAYENNGIDQSVYRKELKESSLQTGLFSSISDEMIRNGEGVYRIDMESMADPMSGLSLPPEEEEVTEEYVDEPEVV